MSNCEIVVNIAIPILAVILGILLKYISERRSHLITYYSHSATFKLKVDNPIDVFTHSIVIRNAGRKAATNVRIGHSTLPNFSIYPPTDYKVNELPDGTKEILIPKFVPEEQISISYLYYPPLVYSGINTYVKSDEGFAKRLNVIQTPKLSKWLQIVSIVFFLIGIIWSIYIITLFIKWLIKIF